MSWDATLKSLEYLADRSRLVNHLVANVGDFSARADMERRLSTLSTDELREMQRTMDAPDPMALDRPMDYTGAASPRLVANCKREACACANDEDGLSLPVMNYEGAASQRLLDRLRGA